MRNDVRKNLESFVLDSNLELLEKKLGRFNLFVTLGVSNTEKVQSSTIRWMLDSRESHGLGDYLLKKILKRIATVNRDHPYLPMTPVEIDLIDTTDAFVQTEEAFSGGHRGDITVLDETNEIYILIENKIRSAEGRGQTKAYVEEVSKRYPSYKRFLVYLSPQGEYPEAPEFLRFSYRDFVEVLKDILETKEDDLSHSSKFLLEQFVRNIEDNILEEGDMDSLCQEIYRKHKTAINRIFLARPKNKQLFMRLGELVTNELDGDWKYRATNSYCAVYRESWRSRLNPSDYMPCIHYEYSDVPNKIRVAIHIEAWGRKDYRRLLKEALKKTEIGEKVRVKWAASQVAFSKIVVRNIEENEVAAEKGSKGMLELIRGTSSYIDKAVNTVWEKTKANTG